MQEVKFINSYSYIFSSRPGTPASKLKVIDNKITKKRLIEFQYIAEKIKINYKKNLINKNVEVLFENKINNENKYFGRDECYNPIIVESDNNLIGKIKLVKIFKGSQKTLFGKIISNFNKKIMQLK